MTLLFIRVGIIMHAKTLCYKPKQTIAPKSSQNSMQCNYDYEFLTTTEDWYLY